jgi:(2Fe-2S) ferredoxin
MTILIMVESTESSRQVLVCQNRSCRKQGAAAVLAAFKASPVTDVTVIGSGCLAQCGSGPMVVVMPDQIWYSRVHPSEVPVVVERHLQGGHPVESMLYRKYHQPDQQS